MIHQTAIIDPAWDISSVNDYIQDNRLILKKILLKILSYRVTSPNV